MRDYRWLLGVLLLVGAFIPLRAAGAAQQDFRVDNSTPWPIFILFVRPSGGGYDWSDDLLGSDETLDAGTTTLIQFNRVIGCIHDIKIQYKNDVWASWSNINLCSISTFKVWYDFGGKKYEASWQ